MMYWSALALVTVASVQAHTFQNLILGDKPLSYPSAIKVDGTYYLVAANSNITDGIFPIHTSTDLTNWKPAGNVFDDRNTPKWPGTNLFGDPEIHKIGSNFIVYFSALTVRNFEFGVGAAIASHPLGPYIAIDQPILALPNKTANFPSIVNDEGKLYLLWCDSGNAIEARELTSSGLSFSSDQTTTLLQPSLTWEAGYVSSPWYFRRGDYHYLLYTGGAGRSGINVGVARSSHALGPYEKRPHPILPRDSNYEWTVDASVVKGSDDMEDLIFFTAARSADLVKVHSVILASLIWKDDNWPFVRNF